MDPEKILEKAMEQTGEKVYGYLSEEDAPTLLKAIQDAGYVIVPREPTEEMVKAADNATATKWSDEAYEWEEPGELVTSVFTAMIEAFPTANPSS